MSLIELKDLSFTYPHAFQPTLKIGNFSVEKGEKIFLFGPSGSGKTTLLEILAGILAPQSGQVRMLGQDLVKMSPLARDHFRADHLGYVFQSFNLIPYLNVTENISLPLDLSPQRRKRLPANRLYEELILLCRELGIEDLLDQPITKLSVGQQQRVGVARALLGNPELILADEPTSALDSDHRERFIRLLFDVCEKHQTTVIFVSHDRSLEKLFSRSVSLSEINQAGRP